MIDVVALGELLIDFATVSTDGAGYPTMAAHPGGAPANFLAALAKFGASTALLGKVGADTFGGLLTATLQAAGIDTRGLVKDDRVFTTLAFVTFDGQGDRAFSFARKPGADTCIAYEELDLSLIDEARVFHFGTLSLTDEPARSATCGAVAYAKSKGKLITYDPNLRKPLWKDPEECRRQLLWGLGQADVVKISDEEVDFLFGLGVEAGAAHILREFGVKLVFVTCGAAGCYFQNPVASGWVSSLSGIKVSDTQHGPVPGLRKSRFHHRREHLHRWRPDPAHDLPRRSRLVSGAMNREAPPSGGWGRICVYSSSGCWPS